MKPAVAGLLAWVLLTLWVPNAAAQRHKPGPVTIRGIALQVTRSGFTLRTTTRGTYRVELFTATRIVEKGHRGQLALANQDHVGVHGFLQGRIMRAMQVRIYPVKPKPYTVKGVVVAVSGGLLVLQMGKRRVTLRLAGATVRTTTGRPATLSVGDRVAVRVVAAGTWLQARTVRVYARRVVGHHITVHGQIVQVAGQTVVVQGGGTRVTVHLASTTVVRTSAGPTRPSALHPGQLVTVHACCAGRPLIATSIRILHAPRPRTILMRGTVTGLSGGAVRLSSGGKTIWVRLTPATTYDRGRPTVGARISVRVYRQGARYVATRVHVYVQRTNRTLRGVVVAVSAGVLTVRARGRRYRLSIGPRTVITLGGRAVTVRLLRSGDRVTVQTAGSSALRVTAMRPPPQVVTLRGTIVVLHGPDLRVSDSLGRVRPVHLLPGCHITFGSRTVPVASLFIGARVRVRGVRRGATLDASSLAVTATSRSVSGRVVATGAVLRLQERDGTIISIHLSPGVQVIDGAARVATGAIKPGVYLHVHGYEEGDGSILAESIEVVHPAIEVVGVVVRAAPHLVVRDVNGQRVAITLSPTITISTGSSRLALRASAIPLGVTVRVYGRVGREGEVVATRITVHLVHLTLRGKVTTLAAGGLSVDAGSGPQRILLAPNATIRQGTHPLRLADVVVGDDVTVVGYAFGAGTILARTLDVHRTRLTVTGTISALTTRGFSLTGANGDTQVVTNAATQVAVGVTVQVGAVVKVSGYLRGDGVLLAGEIRPGKIKGVADYEPTLPVLSFTCGNDCPSFHNVLEAEFGVSTQKVRQAVQVVSSIPSRWRVGGGTCITLGPDFSKGNIWCSTSSGDIERGRVSLAWVT